MLPAFVLSAFLAAAPSDAKGAIPVMDFDEEHLAETQRLFDERVAAGDKVILFKIDSHGGQVELGIDFIHHVQETKGGAEVLCMVDWKAYSMGFLFLQGACDRRLMTPDALLMAHSVAGGVQGKEDALLSAWSAMEAMNDSVAGWASARMCMAKTDYRARTDHTEWWMSSAAALAAHAVDEVISNSALPASFKYQPKEEDPAAALMRILTR